MSAELGRVPEPVGWLDNRNFIVPPDIIPVRRVSPQPHKPRTLCQHRAEGTPVCRAGGRDWFGDHVFVDAHAPDLRNACGTSFTAHASCLVGLLLLLAGPDPTVPQRVSAPLRMPAFVAVMAGGPAGSTGSPTFAAPDRSKRADKAHVAQADPRRKPSAAPDTAATGDANPDEDFARSEPVEAAQTAVSAGDPPNDTNASSSDHDAGGANGGGDGGSPAGGNGAGPGGGGTGPGMSPGPYRLGQGIEPPRKIKHVAPVYPEGALAIRALGTVVIEATVGSDGKVHEAKVVHSIAALDQAALDAVRQWEFTPSSLNGVPVAVIVTILVQFAIH
jgi:protein TonB